MHLLMHDIGWLVDEHRSELSHETIQDGGARKIDP